MISQYQTVHLIGDAEGWLTQLFLNLMVEY